MNRKKQIAIIGPSLKDSVELYRAIKACEAAGDN